MQEKYEQVDIQALTIRVRKYVAIEEAAMMKSDEDTEDKGC